MVHFIGESEFMPYKDKNIKRAKQKEYSKRHYAKNAASVKALVKKNSVNYRKKWKEFKESKSCSNCGFSHPAVIDFHHTDPKTKLGSVTEFANSGSYKKAYLEAEKCIPLCSNCHRILHYEIYENKKFKLKMKKKGAKAP